MSVVDPAQHLPSRTLTQDELEDVAWMESVYRNEPQLIQDSLRQLVTLSSVLLGGAAALAAQTAMLTVYKGFGMSFLFLSLGAALYGLMPFKRVLNPYCREDIREFREDGLKRKTRFLWASAGCLLAAFGVFVAGVIFSGAKP